MVAQRIKPHPIRVNKTQLAQVGNGDFLQYLKSRRRGGKRYQTANTGSE
jgi:hypothetical protein